MATYTKQRLRYIDSSGDTQIIGEINGPGDEKDLSRGQLFHRSREYDKLVARGDVTLKNNLPKDNTEFQGDVPEVFYETYDPATDSWTTRFRGFLINGGLIDRNEEVKALLYDIVKYYSGEKVTVDISGSTTNVAVMKDIAPSDVVIDHPTEPEVQNNSDQDGFVEYDGYSMVGEPRARVVREQTQVTGWALKPTGDQDNNGNFIWRYEPLGYGGTVDTIKDKSSPNVSGTLGIIREWGFTRKENIINHVELINTNDSGSTVIGSYNAATETSPNSVDRYGERYDSFQVGFLSSSKADTLAEKIVDRNKTADEGGNLKAQPRYEGNEANNSFEVRSDQKDINGVFTAVEQINHYPEASTDFTFTFERQSEGEASAAENLRSERRKLYPQSSKGLSGQTGNTAPGVGGNTGNTSPDVGGETGSTGPDVGGETSDTGPNVSGTSDNDGGATVIQSTSDSEGAQNVGSGDGWVSFSGAEVDAGTDSSSGATFHFAIQVQIDGSPASFSTVTGVNMDIRIKDENGKTFPDNSGVRHYSRHMAQDSNGDGDMDRWTTEAINGTIDIPEDTEFREYTLEVNVNQDVIVGVDTHLTVYDEHSHGSGSYDADLHPHQDGTLDTDNHPHQDGTLDTDNHPHGDGSLDTDSHPHQNGTLEASTAEEDKTDR